MKSVDMLSADIWRLRATTANTQTRCARLETTRAVMLLDWALTYATFECSEDNPLHATAHDQAIELVRAAKAAEAEGSAP